MRSSELSHQVGAVVSGVVCDDGWQLEEEADDDTWDQSHMWL